MNLFSNSKKTTATNPTKQFYASSSKPLSESDKETLLNASSFIAENKHRDEIMLEDLKMKASSKPRSESEKEKLHNAATLLRMNVHYYKIMAESLKMQEELKKINPEAENFKSLSKADIGNSIDKLCDYQLNICQENIALIAESTLDDNEKNKCALTLKDQKASLFQIKEKIKSDSLPIEAVLQVSPSLGLKK